MTGGTITVKEMAPALGLKFIYFTVTLADSFKADFTQFGTIYYIKAVDDTTPFATNEAVTDITANVVTFTNGTDIRGFAIVQE